MGNDFGDDKPLWQRQGRSGPNGPRYASRSDRASVRRTGRPGQKKKGCGKAVVVIMLIVLGVPTLGVYGLLNWAGVL